MIHLHSKHGLNPGMLNCFVCNKPKGIAFYGTLGQSKLDALKKAGIHVPPDGEAPRNVVMDYEPCPECEAHMKQGVILISVREPGPKDDPKNPYRTGGWVVVKDEAISRMVQPQELADDIIRKRMAFVPDDAWDMLGLPRATEKTVWDSGGWCISASSSIQDAAYGGYGYYMTVVSTVAEVP